MELRKHPLMVYRGSSNWPPAWKSESGNKQGSPSGEVGTLVDVVPSKIEPDSRCFLTIKHEEKSYVGCLLFDDEPFCQQISKLLRRYRSYPIEYIGGIDLRHSLGNETSSGMRRG